MLESIKTIIEELPDVSFDEYYQMYICDVQDQNIMVEINSVKTDEIISLNSLLSKLNAIRH